MNFGSVSYDSKRASWAIKAQPHVAMRLKRWFGKIDKHTHGTFYLTDTTENCLELQVFMQRYPMKIESGADHLTESAQKYRDGTSLIQDLLAMRREPPKVELALPLRQYQEAAVAIQLATQGLLLADDVGLGKTASAIGTFTNPDCLPAVVVTLTHLPFQWRDEIKKFAPHLKVHIVKKGIPYDLSRNGRNGQISFDDRLPDVIILNYHKLDKWVETLGGFAKSVIWDEVQELRRDESAKYKAARYLTGEVQYCMGLSATPIYNYGGEIYSVMECIRPGALGKKSEFLNEWCYSSYEKGKERIKDPFAFGSYMTESGLMLRRTRADVKRELPKIMRIPHHIDADENALDRVSASCAELARVILGNNEEYRGQKMNASEQLSNVLRQATGIAKAPYVAEFVRLLVESGERVVLYGWHREVYSIWLDKLKDLEPVMYTGTESPTQKEASKKAFLNGDSKVMIMSLRSGAGLDGLQGVCRTVAFGELDWSPGVHEQAVGRVARDGQPEEVFAYFLIATSGADPSICEALGIKQGQVDGIRQESQEVFSKLQTDAGHIKKLAELYLNRTANTQLAEAA